MTTKKQTGFLSIGLMSGTSLDGVDASLIRTDGEQVQKRLGFITKPYSKPLKEALRKLLKEKDSADSDFVLKTEKDMTLFHAEIINELLNQAKLSPNDIYIVGFHGQTIDHQPENAYTWQIGDGPLLAHTIGIDVVYDFRSSDMEHGGQGAPLAPLYHVALANSAGSVSINMPIAILNIGGVANLTYINDEQVIAYDTGPGNALIDDWVFGHTGEEYDKNGNYAAQGKVDKQAVDAFMKHPFFNNTSPKSLDRDDFSGLISKEWSLEDGATTLTEATVLSIKRAESVLPTAPKQWFVCGGGSHNNFLMNRLGKMLTGEVLPIEHMRINGDSVNADAIEAEAFAYLAVRSCQGKPLSLPSTTGVRTSSVTGGVFCPV